MSENKKAKKVEEKEEVKVKKAKKVNENKEVKKEKKSKEKLDKRALTTRIIAIALILFMTIPTVASLIYYIVANR